MPLEKLLREYLVDLQALGRSSEYVYIMEKQIVRRAAECHWATFKDVAASRAAEGGEERLMSI